MTNDRKSEDCAGHKGTERKTMCFDLAYESVQHLRCDRAASFRASESSALVPMKSTHDMTTKHGESRIQRHLSTLNMCRSHGQRVETVPRRCRHKQSTKTRPKVIEHTQIATRQLELPCPMQRSQCPRSPPPSALFLEKSKQQVVGHSVFLTQTEVSCHVAMRFRPRTAPATVPTTLPAAMPSLAATSAPAGKKEEKRKDTVGKIPRKPRNTDAPPRRFATFFFLVPRLRSRSDQQRLRPMMQTTVYENR